jgi:hypothetical protein
LIERSILGEGERNSLGRSRRGKESTWEFFAENIGELDWKLGVVRRKRKGIIDRKNRR